MLLPTLWLTCACAHGTPGLATCDPGAHELRRMAHGDFVQDAGADGDEQASAMVRVGALPPDLPRLLAWLEAVAREVPGGRAWPADPARDAEPDWTLYSGTPGVVLFLAEVAGAAPREEAGARARSAVHAGVGALVAWTERSLAESDPGLYTGAAGVACALLEVARRDLDPRARAAAVAVLEHLHAAARPAEGGTALARATDVISGDAGIGFLLLRAARELDRPQDLALALALGRGLVARAERVPDGASDGGLDGGLDWPMVPGDARRMPNFSHGTAGVATFLAELARVSGDPDLRAAALSGARHVASLAGDGPLLRLPHHLPGGEELLYLGWCHGPAGTARLFRSLATLDPDGGWKALESRAVAALLGAGLPDARPDGYWDNVGLCCGAAGIALALVDHAPKDAAARELAGRLLDDVLARGTRDARGLSFEQCEHRVRPDLRAAQTGWMQGAAGVGHALLRLSPAGADAVRLPDDVGD